MIKLVLDELTFNDWIGIKPHATFNGIIDILYLLGFVYDFLLFELFLKAIFISGGEDSIDGEENLPEDALDECGYHIDNGDMKEAEVEHDVGEVLGCSPAVIERHIRPPCLSQHHHHKLHSSN